MGKVALVVFVPSSMEVSFQKDTSWLMSPEVRFALIPQPVTVKLNELIRALSRVSFTAVIGAVLASPPYEYPGLFPSYLTSVTKGLS